MPEEMDKRIEQAAAALGTECSRACESFMDGLPAKIKEGSLGRLRGLIREHLKGELAQIDAIVSEILSGNSGGERWSR